jgi:cell division protein FtsI/penicillin-binding protein 2
MREKVRPNMTDSTNKRITLFIVFFTFLIAIIMYKLFSIQVIDSVKYRLAAKKQYESKISLKPSRGLIFDRKMNALISNVNSYSFAADPNMVDNKDSVASVFSKIFNKEKSYYIEKLNSKNTSFVWLERRIESKYENSLKDLDLSGVIKLNEAHRIFNYEGLGSQVIGYTSIDNIGLSGVELELNEVLSGKDGYVVMQKDGLGRKRPAVEYPREEPVEGNNVILTIDMNIQKIAEEELSSAVSVNNAIGGKVVVMAVKTGEILALNSISLDGSSPDKIAVITDLYEPGSTFKVVTAAAALEEGLQSKTDIISTYGGEYLKIRDAHRFANMTFQQVIEQSSNIGIIQVANILGRERFYKYARDFGCGISTGIDLPGEMKGRLKRPVEFSPVSLDYMSIGYEVLVNALQMTNAYACVANGGMMMKPFIIKRILSPDGKVVKENQPTEIRNVISKTTARTLTELLTGVVERGTGIDARIDNIKIAGKTGTSQKLVEGEYSKSKYTSSFIGYFPAENPQMVISVIIDAPGSGEYYGGKVAAPVFKNIARRIIDLTGLHEYSAPDYMASNIVLAGNVQQNHTPEQPVGNDVLNFVNFDVSDAVKILKEKEIGFVIEGPVKNAIVTGEESFTDEKGVKKIRLFTSGGSLPVKSVKENPAVMPYLKSLSVRKCINVLSSLGVNYKIEGSGRVLRQNPEAGAVINKDQTVIVTCGF